MLKQGITLLRLGVKSSWLNKHWVKISRCNIEVFSRRFGFPNLAAKNDNRLLGIAEKNNIFCFGSL